MTISNHRECRYPAPCCRTHNNGQNPEGGEPRVHATCCVDSTAPDSYGVMTTTPVCTCKRHCEVCSKEAK